MTTKLVETRSGREIEVSAMAPRRRFSVEYKRRILKEAAACTGTGELGAMLRREGLYASHLTAWRYAQERGELAAPRKPGPKPKVRDARDQRIADLERANSRLTARLERAEALIELQKKVAALLGRELPPSNEE